MRRHGGFLIVICHSVHAHPFAVYVIFQVPQKRSSDRKRPSTSDSHTITGANDAQKLLLRGPRFQRLSLQKVGDVLCDRRSRSHSKDTCFRPGMPRNAADVATGKDARGILTLERILDTHVTFLGDGKTRILEPTLPSGMCAPDGFIIPT